MPLLFGSSPPVPDASSSKEGKVQLTNHLGGIATAPTVVNFTLTSNANANSNKITNLTNGSSAQDAAAFGQIPTALPPSGSASGDLTGTYPSPTIKSSVGLTGIPTAPTASGGTNTTQLATTAFVESEITANATPDATTLIKGKVQLAGDLTGTAALPTIKSSVALSGSPTTTTQTPSDSSTKIATTQYVDTAVLQSPAKEAVKYASIATLPSIVYANGSSGVGATLTGVALGAISLDSSSPSVGDRVLIKNQASTFQNGIYSVTATGSGIAVFVLTRTGDFDQSTDIKTGDSMYVVSGSTLAGTTWDTNSPDNPVMGTDPITFAQTAGPGSVTGGNGITVTGSSIAIDTSVTVDKNTAQILTNKSIVATQLTGTLQAAQFPALTGDIATSAGSLTTALASIVTGATVGSATQIPVITYDNKGRITSTTTATPTASTQRTFAYFAG